MNYPTSIEVNGKKYQINTDFRVAIRCEQVATDYNISNNERALAIIYLLFGEKALNDVDNYEQFLILAKKFLGCGKEIDSDILLKLHIWKCTGNYKAAEEFYNKYSEVDELFLKIRQIIINASIPRRLELDHTLKLVDGKVELIEYPATMEGIIQGYVDRLGTSCNKNILDLIVKYDDEKFLE